MSRLRKNHISRTQYSDPVIQTDEMQNLSEEDRELAARIEQRRTSNRRNQVRRKRRRVVVLVLVFAVLLTTCTREIVRLKAENRALKKQHAQLEQERDRLTKELGRVGDKDYIKEQARKQLRLLDPGEKMFVFEDGETPSEEAAAQEEEKAEESSEEEETKEEGSSDE